jgi:hypothetical protein
MGAEAPLTTERPFRSSRSSNVLEGTKVIITFRALQPLDYRSQSGHLRHAGVGDTVDDIPSRLHPDLLTQGAIEAVHSELPENLLETQEPHWDYQK